MTKAKTSVRYKYDALGRRVMTTGGRNGTTKYSYTGLDVVMDDSSVSGITKYQNGPGIDNKLSLKAGGDARYFLQDHLGSTTALTDTTGAITASQSYDSFGNPTNANFPSRYQFTGREYDPTTGLQFSRARFYDPKLGKFISEDPIGLNGGDLNLYGYVHNGPIGSNDPFGLYDPADYEVVREVIRQAPSVGPGAGVLLIATGKVGAVAVGGFTAGYAIGYYPGQWTANSPYNPFVYGPLNPFGTPFNPFAGPIPQPQPQGSSNPYCQPKAPRPFFQSPPFSSPFFPPIDRESNPDECQRQYDTDSAICRSLPTESARGRCWKIAADRLGDCIAGRNPRPLIIR